MKRQCMVLCFIGAVGLFASCASQPDDSTGIGLLSLAWQKFDQTPNSGWRIYAARHDYKSAARLIEAYLKGHPDLTVWQRAVSHFHAGMAHVYDGDITSGVLQLDQALVPEKTAGLSDDWNDMVIAHRAFVTQNRGELFAAKERMAKLPGSRVEWAGCADELLQHFGERYGSWR